MVIIYQDRSVCGRPFGVFCTIGVGVGFTVIGWLKGVRCYDTADLCCHGGDGVVFSSVGVPGILPMVRAIGEPDGPYVLTTSGGRAGGGILVPRWW